MNKAAMEATKRIATMSDKQLFEVWEMTSTNNSEYIPTVRGWIMDEIEKRYPEAFDKWLEEDAEDNTLKEYCKVA